MAGLISVNKVVTGPQPAFANRNWENYRQPGANGQIIWDRLRKESISPHAGVSKSGEGAYVVTPDFTGSTVSAPTCAELGGRFANGLVAGRTGLIYSRLGHRPGFELECALAGLHGSGDAMVFGSGMAALSHLLLSLAGPGDNIVSHRTIYGCSDDLLTTLLPSHGVETRMLDMRDPRLLSQAIDSRTRAVLLETPANPSLDLINISTVANVVGNRHPIIVDNTFMSPVLQNPFEQGAHFVIYSMTKSVGGLSNATGGAVLGSGAFIDELFSYRKDLGGMLAAREASAFLQGIKTLFVRVEKMQENAIEVANMLAKSGKVEWVHYPLLDDKTLINGQMKGPGYMIAFEMKGGMDAGMKLLDNLQMIPIAVSLGGVDTLICHPASTTHAVVARERRLEKGITDGLVRLSVGIEHVQDIIGDLAQSLAKL